MFIASLKRASGWALPCKTDIARARTIKRYRKLLFLSGVLFLSALPPARAPASTPSAITAARGLYVFGNRLRSANAAQPLSTFRNSNIDGVALFSLWSTVEPSDGTYDWSSIDPDIKHAVANGKKISIEMTAGDYTPSWIYSEGVQSVSLYFGAHDLASKCAQIRLPTPWNTIYQQKFLRLMGALLNHLKSVNGAYDAVRIVKLTGVNNITPELHQTAVTCRGRDAPTIWKTVGYRPSLVIGAWEAMANYIALLFPDKLLAVDVLTTGDFPLINNAGQTIENTSEPTYVDVKSTVLAWATSAQSGFASRFAVQWDALNSTRPARVPPVQWNQRAGSVIGWQTNAFGGNIQGALCGSADYNTAKPCTAAGYQAILDQGISAGGQYIEVFPLNVSAFPDAIAEAHAKLMNAAEQYVAKGQ